MYNYRSNPRERAHVLASLDETSYTGGTMNGDHPIAWCQDYQGGRAFYTGGGHTKESYADPAFRQHLLGGIRWVIGDTRADCRPENGYRPPLRRHLPGRLATGGPGRLHPLRRRHAHVDRGTGAALVHPVELRLVLAEARLEGRRRRQLRGVRGLPALGRPLVRRSNNGYEIQIDATDVPEKTTGSVYGFRSADLKKRDRALNPPGEWNTYEIPGAVANACASGSHGVKINDFTNTDPARSLRDGHIGIQNHGTGDDVSFRDIRIKELPAKGR
ncbi:hypothetical protein GCM10017687_87890 [Streptomyces echinatus]